MSNNVDIREYKPEDKPFLEALMKEFNDYISSLDAFKRVEYKQGAAAFFLNKMIREARDNNGKVFVALFENKIAGFIGGYIQQQTDEELMETIKAKPGYINEFFVSNSYRGQKVGLALMNKLEEYFMSQGCDIVRTAVFSPNKLARSFYEKSGFHERDINIVKTLY